MEPIRLTGDLAEIQAAIPQAVELAATLPNPDEDQPFSGVPALLGTLPNGAAFSLVTYPPDGEGRPRLLAVVRIPPGRFMEAAFQDAVITTPEFLLGAGGPGAVSIILAGAFEAWEAAILSRARY